MSLSAAVDLRRIAEWIGTPVQTIQRLNPELRRWTTPVRATDYELKVPEGTAEIVRAHVAQADPDDLAPLNWHTVKKGETLLSISRKLKVNRTDLAEANYLSTKAKVSTGQRLIIPRAPALLLASGPDNPPPVTESRPVEAVVSASNTAPDAGEARQASLTYRVKRGDTLFRLQALPHDGRLAQDLESPAHQLDPDRTALKILPTVPRLPRTNPAIYLGIRSTWASPGSLQRPRQPSVWRLSSGRHRSPSHGARARRRTPRTSTAALR